MTFKPTYNAAGLLGRVGSLLENVFVVSALTLFSGAFAPLFGVTGQTKDGNPTMQLVYLAVYAISAGLMLLHLSSAGRVLRSGWWVVALVLLALVSVDWSSAPSITIRRAIALGGSTLFGLCIAARYDTRKQLALVAWASGIGVAFSLFVSIVAPIHGLGLHAHGTGWQGVFVHKNSLGRAMAFSSLIFMVLRTSRLRIPVVVYVLLPASLFLLIMSRSITSLVVLVVLMLALPAFRILRMRSNLQLLSMLLATISLGFVANVMWYHAGEVVGALGRNLTVSGRTQLWRLVMSAVAQRPWLGYGYSGFWLGWAGPSAGIWAQTGWMPPDAHNGWLDVLLALGAVGLGLFTVVLVLGFVRSVRYLRTHSTSIGQWPLMFFAFLVLTNLTESSFLVRNDIFWVVQVALTVRLGIALRGHQSR